MENEILEENIKNYGYINYNNRQKILVFNKADAIMYDELYGFKTWPSVELDMITQKLSDTNKYTFTEIWEWMDEFKINGASVQFIIVRDDIGLYKIYCNYFEALIFFRNHIFNIDVILISVNLKVNLNGSQLPASHKLGYFEMINNLSGMSEYREGPMISHYNKIINFLDSELEKQKYGYSYTPKNRPGRMETIVESNVYILDRLEPTEMNILDNFRTEFKNLNNQCSEPDNVYGFLAYDKSPTIFGKYPHSFWDGGL